MAKVLKVTKPDKTIHVVPITNREFYQHLNNRIFTASQRFLIEEIDESEAKDMPFIDENFISPSEAQQAVPDLQKRIAELEAQLHNAQKIDPASASVPYAAESPATEMPTAEQFTRKIINNPDGNAPETNSTIAQKEIASATKKK